MTRDFLTIKLPMGEWIAVYECDQPFGQVSRNLVGLQKLPSVTHVGREDAGFCPLVRSEARSLKEIGELFIGIDQVFTDSGYALGEPYGAKLTLR